MQLVLFIPKPRHTAQHKTVLILEGLKLTVRPADHRILIKPEDKAVYYVINGDFSDKIEL